MWGNVDFYKVLGVSVSAAPEDIKSAYRALALRFHPDTSQGHVTQLFREIHEAYRVLGDQELRASYDRWRIEKGLVSSSQQRVNAEFLLSQTTMPCVPEPQILYVLVDISSAQAATADRLPLNLCFVVDHSTSMRGARLQRAKEAIGEIMDQLSPEDALSVVTFSDRAEIVIPAQTGLDKIKARSLLNNIQASGATEIYRGLLEGKKQIDQWRSYRYVSHIVLLTDGQTYGDQDSCVELATEVGRQQVGITAVGVGSDWNDRLLDQIADRSGGSSHYLESPAELAQLFSEKVKELANILAQQVTLTARLGTGMALQHVYRLAPSPAELQSTDDVFLLGPLGISTGQTALLEAFLSAQLPGQHRLAQIEIAARLPVMTNVDSGIERIEKDIIVTFADKSVETHKVPQRIISAVGKINLYQIQEKVLTDIDQGQLPQAARRLQTVATRLLDWGEIELAKAALLEAGQLNKSGALSQKMAKQLKYGTRSLLTGSGRNNS